MSDQAVDTYHDEEFMPRAHRVGRGTLLLAMGLCLLPALYLSFVLGAYPGTGVVLGAFLAVAAFAGIVWIVEPISYFPMLGVCGSYMSFLSGNIGNMRLPVVISCQTAIGAEQGSKRAEVAPVVGIAVSILVNLAFLIVLVVIGQALIDAMPAPMAVALRDYTFPALYGAVFVMFLGNAKTRTIGLAGVAVALVVLALPLSSVFTTTAAGVLGIVTSFAMARGGRQGRGIGRAVLRAPPGRDAGTARRSATGPGGSGRGDPVGPEQVCDVRMGRLVQHPPPPRAAWRHAAHRGRAIAGNQPAATPCSTQANQPPKSRGDSYDDPDATRDEPPARSGRSR